MKFEEYVKEVEFEFVGNKYEAACEVREWGNGKIKVLDIQFVSDSNGQEVWHINMFEVIEKKVEGEVWKSQLQR